jgi:poly(A) polymerase
MNARLDPEKHSWMRAAETRAVMDALTADGGEARFVGGAVRNALLGEPVTDIDVATPLTPEEVTKRLARAGLQVVPTGIEHGTVTAVVMGKPFEVTTLRRDVTTDGRHAVVAFTTDWAEDAARRDFTINAIYASRNGVLFDPTGGGDDLKAGRVRFVGEPAKRIHEDYLRILRLFRFHAWYGKGSVDKAALTAAKAEKAGLKRLSGERVQKEILRLLSARDPMPALQAAEKAGILSEILPQCSSLDRLEWLIAADHANSFAPDPLLRLAALLPPDKIAALTVAEYLKLSNADRDRLIAAMQTSDEIEPSMSAHQARVLLYRHGAQWFNDAVRLHWAADSHPAHGSQWRALLALADGWKRPHFPLDGRDVMAAGVEEGPRVGHILADIEEWWLARDFSAGREALLARLKAIVRAKAG